VSELAQREERTAWWLLLPSLLVIAVIAVYPLGQVFYSSFTNARFASAQPVEVVGFANYVRLLSFTVQRVPEGENPRLYIRTFNRDQPAESRKTFNEVGTYELFGATYVIGATNAAFIKSIGDTVLFTVISVFFETVLGMIIALALQAKFIGRNIMRTAMLIPWAIITVVSALIWEWMYSSTRYGLFNSVLDRLGWIDPSAPVSFLTNPSLQLPAIAMIDIWKTTPFMALLLLAGLATIPKELYEAAEMDGASKIRQFFSVTLPLLSPVLAVALVFRTLDSLRVFDLFQVVFGERRYSMASFAQDTLISSRDIGLSSASSVIIFIIIFAFAFAYIRILGVNTGE
jgi:trehalose/maltose transport system permease protein